jgi:hypothetical protein
MILIGLDGKEYHKAVNATRYPRKPIEECRSNFQYEIGNKLQEIFPKHSILEEIPTFGVIPLLYLDFFIPTLKIAVECHGNQHFNYNPFFHGNRHKFASTKINDAKKAEWCGINDIRLVIISEKNLTDIRKVISEQANK